MNDTYNDFSMISFHSYSLLLSILFHNNPTILTSFHHSSIHIQWNQHHSMMKWIESFYSFLEYKYLQIVCSLNMVDVFWYSWCNASFYYHTPFSTTGWTEHHIQRLFININPYSNHYLESVFNTLYNNHSIVTQSIYSQQSSK